MNDTFTTTFQFPNLKETFLFWKFNKIKKDDKEVNDVSFEKCDRWSFDFDLFHSFVSSLAPYLWSSDLNIYLLDFTFCFIHSLLIIRRRFKSFRWHSNYLNYFWTCWGK